MPISAPRTHPRRVGHAVCYDPVNDKIYMYGGITESLGVPRFVTDLQCYDPITDSWTDLAPMDTARAWIKGVYCRGKLYALAGLFAPDPEMAFGVSEEYDIAGDSWTRCSYVPYWAFGYEAGIWRDSIYYIMGGRFWNCHMFVNYRDPEDGWPLCTELPRPWLMADLCFIGDTIYIAGGWNPRTGEVYDDLLIGAIDPEKPTVINWSFGPKLPHPRFNGPTLALNGKVYWFGGFTSSDTSVATDSGYVYDPATGRIDPLPCYPTGVARCCLGVAREGHHELYGLGGYLQDTSATGYYKLVVGEGIAEPENASGATSVGSRLDVATPIREGGVIRYTLPQSSRVSLRVLDAGGRLIRTLANSRQAAGDHTLTWNRTDEQGRKLAEGVYFIRMTSPNCEKTRKAVVAE